MQIGEAVVMERLCRCGSGLSCAGCSDNDPRRLACVFGLVGPPGLGCGRLGRGLPESIRKGGEKR